MLKGELTMHKVIQYLGGTQRCIVVLLNCGKKNFTVCNTLRSRQEYVCSQKCSGGSVKQTEEEFLHLAHCWMYDKAPV